MRWKRPQLGEKRCIKRFAILPISIDRETRWLEWVYIEQYADEKMVISKGYVLAFGDIFWKNKRFISYSEYVNSMIACPLSEGLKRGIYDSTHEGLKSKGVTAFD